MDSLVTEKRFPLGEMKGRDRMEAVDRVERRMMTRIACFLDSLTVPGGIKMIHGER
jgi:hypothetical protein